MDKEVTLDRLITIIGTKEVELSFYKEQIAQLQQENETLKQKEKKT